MLGHKSRRVSLKMGVVLLSIAAIPGLWTGCGVSATSLCDKTCECEGCSEAEHQACVDEIEANQKVAEAEGCSIAYDALIRCLDEHSQCFEKHIDASGCDSEQARAHAFFSSTSLKAPSRFSCGVRPVRASSCRTGQELARNQSQATR